MIYWCKNMLKNEKNQEELESKIQTLLDGPLKNKSEYAQEKCIKSFSETIMYLESSLIRMKKINVEDNIELLYSLNEDEDARKDYFEKYYKIQEIITKEINRQYRHYITFLY